MKKYGIVAVVIGLVGVGIAIGYMIVGYFSCGKTPELATAGQRYSETAVSADQYITEIKDKQLANKELLKIIKKNNETIMELQDLVITLERETSGQGETSVNPHTSEYTVNWSELWSDGQTITDGVKSSYSIAYHIPPIDLQIYQTDKNWYAGTTTEGVKIGKLTVTQEKPSWWSDTHFQVSVNAASYENKIKPFVGIGGGYKNFMIVFGFSKGLTTAGFQYQIK